MDGVVELGPHGVKHAIGVTDITGQRARAVAGQVGFGKRGVEEKIAFAPQQAEGKAGLE